MSRYSKIRKIKSPTENNGAEFYSTPMYPNIPLSENDTYVLTVEGDRLDLLASQFYGDKNLWWIISCANKDLAQNSLHVPDGTQLRIPISPGKAIGLFNKLN